MLKPSARWLQPWTSTGNKDVQSCRIVVFLFLFLHVSTVEHWGDYLGVFFWLIFNLSLFIWCNWPSLQNYFYTHACATDKTQHQDGGDWRIVLFTWQRGVFNTSYSKHLLQSKEVRRVSSEYSTNIDKKFLQHEQYGKRSHCFPLFNTSWQASSSILLVLR